MAPLRLEAYAGDPILCATDGPGGHGVRGCASAARLPRLSGAI
jgi:hypothetical protein